MKTFRSSIGPSDREGVRREVFEGHEHLVVPVVMIVDGVLNDALVTQEEYGKYPDAWNGRPVPVLHPERDGIPVSANQPDVIEANSIGFIFNAFVDNGKLKAEAWINTDKARRLGYGELLSALEAGELVEVSTGYFADEDMRPGEFDGREYQVVHRNIRPDHLALLPGEIGACSVADGCGTRVNSSGNLLMRTKEAIEVLAKALGLRANCECSTESEATMSDELIKQAEKLKANGKLTAKQFEMLQGLEDDQRRMVRALMDAMEGMPAEEPESAEGDMPPDEEDMPAMSANKGAGKKAKGDDSIDLSALVANEVNRQMRRNSVIQKLTTNEKNPFTEDEMQAMSVEHLEKLEKSIRPADYSGQGGFSTNGGVTEDVQPLVLNRGVLSAPAKREQ